MTAVLEELRAAGAKVIYSSELVSPDMKVLAPLHGTDPMTRAREALAGHGLILRKLDSDYFVVARASPTPEQASADAPDSSPSPPALEEVSVYASRYALGDGAVGEPHFLSSTDIEQVPGSREDALRATRVLPGIATNGSSRAYIRGSLLDDVLVQFDGVPLADPFHMKNFQSLISAFDTAAVGRIEVFSGGFPVQYGTRSGGVIDIAPRTLSAGYEHSIGASRLTYNLATVGHGDHLPLDWLATLRHSTRDVVIKPVNGDVGEPQFADTLGRVSWHPTDSQSWTLGWLLLDDRIDLTTESADERATARYRDEYVWGAHDRRFGKHLHSRTVLALTKAERTRDGDLAIAGLANGHLNESRDFESVALRSDWEYRSESGRAWTYGFEATRGNADLLYDRTERFAEDVASAFSRRTGNDLSARATPRERTYALYAAAHHRWSATEAELGARFDAQDYRGFKTLGRVSPRFNIRYDLRPHVSLYGSWGRFTQAQRVDEWRLEEAQDGPDEPALAIHTIVGISYEQPDAGRLTLEVYRKRWSNVQPYFDNRLNTLSLVPDLQPDRLRVTPNNSEAAGIELSARRTFTSGVEIWASYAWSHVEDELEAQDAARSWDQPHALTMGTAWHTGRINASALVGWHRGWPSTPVMWVPQGTGMPAQLMVGARNSQRWRNYFTVDLRAEWTIPTGRSEWSAWAEVTNVGDRRNECCVRLTAPQISSAAAGLEPGSWLPRILNVGVTWRVRNR